LNHGQLKLTESKFYRISGDSTQHRGVVPDIDLPTLYNLPKSARAHWKMPCRGFDRAGPPYKELPSMITTLRERHLARVEHDPDFRYLEGELALAKKRDAANTVSLSEKIRLAERQRRGATRTENQRRAARVWNCWRQWMISINRMTPMIAGPCPGGR
jgi:carboxyl-terminal processing protease